MFNGSEIYDLPIVNFAINKVPFSSLRYDNSCDLKTDSRPGWNRLASFRDGSQEMQRGLQLRCISVSPFLALARQIFFLSRHSEFLFRLENDNFTRGKFLSVLPNAPAALAGKVIGKKNRRVIFGVPGFNELAAPLALPLNRRNRGNSTFLITGLYLR